MTIPQKSNYLFGDSNLAARRLELLAHVFDGSTRAFLTNAAGGSAWRLAVDLGCGPGFTTRLVAEALQCGEVVGLDTSETFVKLAGAATPPGPSFAAHDVTRVPFPCGSADIIFCRFLLTHLVDPDAAIRSWITQLNSGGLLLLEETETIRTTQPVFTRYLQIVEAMLASQSNRLYAGPFVRALDSPSGFRPLLNELQTVQVRSRDAARLFMLNMQAWRDSEFVRANYSRESILELEIALRKTAEEKLPAREVIWEIRQAAFHRESP
jgi:SAM-dependent methyltransferase